MCGRYVRRSPLQHVVDLFSATLQFPGMTGPPRYNIAPTQDVLAVRLNSKNEREISELRWGLVPSWADDSSVGSRLINARSETVAEKPAFREAYRRRRCILPADGFYEWKSQGKTKQPYYIRRTDQQLFGLAGLWEFWKRGGQTIHSCTILTTSANTPMQQIHHRMPLILPPAAIDAWLDPDASPDTINSLLHRPPDEELAIDPVSQSVNSPKNDMPHCIERLASSPPTAPSEGNSTGEKENAQLTFNFE